MPTPVADGVFADTNVWVNAAVLTAPRHAQAVVAVGRPATGALWTSRQVVREFLAVMSRPQTFFPGNVPMSDILNRARLIELQCRVAEDGPDVANSCTTCWRSATRAENRSTMQTSWRHARSWDPHPAHRQRQRLCPLGAPHRGARAVALVGRGSDRRWAAKACDSGAPVAWRDIIEVSPCFVPR